MSNNVQIIQYEGNNETFVWKHQTEDFNSLTQLIVHESQEAVFFMNGQALDLFGAGRYTLETQNIPLLSKIIGRITGGITPFHCEVYFVNKTELMSIKWGTDSKVQYSDPKYHFPLAIGASGEMSLRVEDSRKLLVKLVGTETYLGKQELTNYFRGVLMTTIKSHIAQTIKANGISVFELDENLDLFSKSLHELLKEDFAAYGVSLERFFVTTVAKPDGDKQYERFKDLHFRKYADVEEAKLQQQLKVIGAQGDAQIKVIDSQAEALKRKQEGYTYQQERGFDVAERVAENESVGQFTNLGVGLGTMAGVGGVVAGTMGGAMNEALAQNPPVQGVKCAACGTSLPADAKFCLECGGKVVARQENTVCCPQCGNNVAKGNFCPQCGYRFKTLCPACGNDVETGAKFCHHCGGQL